MQPDFSPDKYINDKNLLKLTLIQTEKDFQEIGESIEIEKNFISFESLVLMLSEKLNHIDKKNPSLLQQLFYRIDISETKVKNIINESDNFFKQVAELILKRELQKVVIREHYKKQHHESFD